MSVVVFGSINMDLVARTPRLPVAGETLTGHTFFTAPGGKGANQAVACARIGAPTRMIGRVGDDMFGAILRDTLHANGIDISGIATASGQPSGVAVIAVDDAAENAIIVIPGANGTIGAEDLARLDAALIDARILLLQLEIPLDAVVAAAHLGRQRGAMVILDPAPACELPPELYPLTDIITPNETEAAILVGFPISGPETAERAAQVLLERGAHSVILKLGGHGALFHDGTAPHVMPAFRVPAVDTVAAGDAFNGALAAALDGGKSLLEALDWGMAAGAYAVTKAGAQPSLPGRAEVIALLHGSGTEIRDRESAGAAPHSESAI